jgi:hypothetical protein
LLGRRGWDGLKRNGAGWKLKVERWFGALGHKWASSRGYLHGIQIIENPINPTAQFVNFWLEKHVQSTKLLHKDIENHLISSTSNCLCQCHKTRVRLGIFLIKTTLLNKIQGNVLLQRRKYSSH